MSKASEDDSPFISVTYGDGGLKQLITLMEFIGLMWLTNTMDE